MTWIHKCKWIRNCFSLTNNKINERNKKNMLFLEFKLWCEQKPGSSSIRSSESELIKWIQSPSATFAKVWWTIFFASFFFGKLHPERRFWSFNPWTHFRILYILFIVKTAILNFFCVCEWDENSMYTERKTITIQFSSVNSHWMNAFFAEHKKKLSNYTYL